MKIFEQNPGSYSEKINFVDDNNVLVGFDYSQSCCEQFGYFLTNVEPKGSLEEPKVDLTETFNTDGYNFDPNYFETLNGPSEYDEKNYAVFKLTHPTREALYLVLYNHHNGYYSHGFSMSKDKTVVQQGRL